MTEREKAAGASAGRKNLRAELSVAVNRAAAFTKSKCGMKTAASRAVSSSWPGEERKPQAASVTSSLRKSIPAAAARAEPQKISVQAERKKHRAASFPRVFSFSR